MPNGLLTLLTFKGYKVTNHVTSFNNQNYQEILDTVFRKCSMVILFY